ncbi:MAG: 3-deoxy-D-manno-octulosonic acid transferase [Gammaproteobacteria bacterium]|nr:MAG: 3-deoxy-D-manno-octulosonic acid transferase [Gammaproteobacteria bacterium]
MSRWFYSALLHCLLPAALLRLWLRGRRNPAYRLRWAERLGQVPPLPDAPRIWLHAVSVGETIAAAPLLRRLQGELPGYQWLVSTTTPTGSEQVLRLFGNEVAHHYLPWDLPEAVARFLDRTRPALLLVMETEIWPNLFAACRRRDIPVCIVNARLSERSLRGYRRIRPLVAEALSSVRVLAQSEADAGRFRSLGAPDVRVTGNLKFDLEIPATATATGEALRLALGHRPVWVAGSTHEGEDAQVLEAHQRLLEDFPDALLILVPRHPERFDDVARQIEARGLAFRRRSSGALPGGGDSVYLGDTLGELLAFYAAADVAFVGGSLVPHGGHNPLEPAALGVPVITGPHWHNFAAIYPALLEQGAAFEVGGAEALAAALQHCLGDPVARDRAGEAGRQFVETNRGALQRTLEALPLPSVRRSA